MIFRHAAVHARTRTPRSKAVADWLKAKPGANGTPQVFRLFGYAGTGKTTLAKHIADEADGEVKFAAFTGKAASVMRGKGCRGASTIHGLIYRARESGEEIPSFDLWDEAPASKAELIIIDECSMVDAELGRDLLSFGVPLLVLGDPAQLPPIQGGGFFTEAEPDVMLTEVHRQAQDDPIVRLSMDIRAGEYLEPGRYGETEVVAKSDLDPQRVLEADQVLVGRNATRRAYNIRMRERRGFEDAMPSAGDKLVCLRNNRKKGLFNGGLWTVKERGARKGGAKTGIMTHAADARRRDRDARREGVGAAGMLHRRHREARLAAAQALRRVRLRLRAHRAQGARLAMGRRGAVRREFCVSRFARALALYGRHAGGEAADGGGVDFALSSRPSERSEREPGPILRSLSIGCGVWVPAFAGTTKERLRPFSPPPPCADAQTAAPPAPRP